MYLTPETIRQVLEHAVWPHSAWALANLYLCSLDAELLSDEAPRLVGGRFAPLGESSSALASSEDPP